MIKTVYNKGSKSYFKLSKRRCKIDYKKMKNGFDFSKFIEDSCKKKVKELIELLLEKETNETE